MTTTTSAAAPIKPFSPIFALREREVTGNRSIVPDLARRIIERNIAANNCRFQVFKSRVESIYPVDYISVLTCAASDTGSFAGHRIELWDVDHAGPVNIGEQAPTRESPIKESRIKWSYVPSNNAIRWTEIFVTASQNWAVCIGDGVLTGIQGRYVRILSLKDGSCVQELDPDVLHETSKATVIGEKVFVTTQRDVFEINMEDPAIVPGTLAVKFSPKSEIFTSYEDRLVFLNVAKKRFMVWTPGEESYTSLPLAAEPVISHNDKQLVYVENYLFQGKRTTPYQSITFQIWNSADDKSSSESFLLPFKSTDYTVRSLVHQGSWIGASLYSDRSEEGYLVAFHRPSSKVFTIATTKHDNQLILTPDGLLIAYEPGCKRGAVRIWSLTTHGLLTSFSCPHLTDVVYKGGVLFVTQTYSRPRNVRHIFTNNQLTIRDFRTTEAEPSAKQAFSTAIQIT